MNAWDTELLLLGGDDRAALRDRAVRLADFLDREPGTRLTDLAFTLSRDLADGGCRLGVVAGSAAEAGAKLRRSADRLADPSCRQIRDVTGAYFFSEPLYPAGALAAVCPGEGAQYLNMFGDLLPHFPEVAEVFASCDRSASDTGRDDGVVSRLLFLPAGASPEDAARAEATLRELGNSILSVSVADLAVTRLLTQLDVPVSAFGGHSAGELPALIASGAMVANLAFAPRLRAIMDSIERQEKDDSGPGFGMLAVGAGRAAVTEVAARSHLSGVLVAMDNCPRQSVAVGPAGAVAALEAALRARGTMCERLPFRRPYHTPGFEPWMGPFRELFTEIEFRPPAVPVYSATTGERFPDDPDELRRLTLAHWVSPVEFTRMIETMYADGVRVFVEAGPRGNLSAFVEDILRGRPFAALPANLPRRSGPTQLNHLVAQLACHQVPVRLDHLYERRSPRSVDWGSCGSGAARGGQDSPGIMSRYFEVMHQFLHVQRTVMETYLRSPSAPAGIADPLGAVGTPEPTPAEPAADELTAEEPAADELTAEEPAETRPWALIGTVQEHEPGQTLVFRRPLLLGEDLYANDHTLGGRNVSTVNPGQNGLPIVPMTFSVETMAEAAAVLFPDDTIVGVRSVKLSRWLPYDDVPIEIEVRATALPTTPEPDVSRHAVRVTITDLAAGRVAVQGTVLVAENYPPPPTEPVGLTDAQPCRVTIPDLYRNMFHGPRFQGIRSLDRFGPAGIEGTVEVLPRSNWFDSTRDPRMVTDPVLTDAAMHVLGAWHLEQPDWAGRILLPMEVRQIDWYGPPPAVGSRLVCVGRNEAESPRHVRHGLDVSAADGSPWCRLRGATYWRFYLPFGHVNFFGPKDEYYLSRRRPDAVPAGDGACTFLEIPLDLKQPVLRSSAAKVTLTAAELREFQGLRAPDAALDDWLFSRIVAKDAFRAVWSARRGVNLFPADIHLERDGDLFVPRPLGQEADRAAVPRIAVACDAGRVAALAGFGRFLGIAVGRPRGGEIRSVARSAVAAALGIDGAETAGWDVRGVAGSGNSATVWLPSEVTTRYPELRTNQPCVRVVQPGDAVIATTMCEPACP